LSTLSHHQYGLAWRIQGSSTDHRAGRHGSDADLPQLAHLAARAGRVVAHVPDRLGELVDVLAGLVCVRAELDDDATDSH
jgi:hypothetical protein